MQSQPAIHGQTQERTAWTVRRCNSGAKRGTHLRQRVQPLQLLERARPDPIDCELGLHARLELPVHVAHPNHVRKERVNLKALPAPTPSPLGFLRASRDFVLCTDSFFSAQNDCELGRQTTHIDGRKPERAA